MLAPVVPLIHPSTKSYERELNALQKNYMTLYNYQESLVNQVHVLPLLLQLQYVNTNKHKRFMTLFLACERA